MNPWERLPLAPHDILTSHSDAEAREELKRWSAAPRFRGCTAEEWQSALERDDAVWREARPVHVSTSAVVFCRDPHSGSAEALLLWHLRAAEWVYPGGHADGDWNFLRSALREVREETALGEAGGTPLWLHARRGVPPGVPAAVQRIEVGDHAHLDAVYYLECAYEEKARVVTDARESGGFQWWKPSLQETSPLPRATWWALEDLDTLALSAPNAEEMDFE